MNKLEELPALLGTERHMVAWVSRDKRLLRLDMTLPEPTTTWRLSAKNSALVDRWLEPAHQQPVA